MKSLAYIANIRMPTEKAHGIQVMKTCEALAGAGVAVTLFVPSRASGFNEDPFSFYGVEKKFTIKRLPVLDTVRFGWLGFIFESFVFSIFSARFCRQVCFDRVYSREILPLLLLSMVGVITDSCYEAHTGSHPRIARFLSWRGCRISCISNGIADFYRTHGVAASSIVVIPDAVDVEAFSVLKSREECRALLNFSREQKIILYAGHLYSWKGVDTLAKSAAFSPEALFVFIGGTEKDVAAFRVRYADLKNILILGRRPHRDMPLFMKAVDIVVLPTSGKTPLGARYTSPLKLFEYMASGTPIVASDLPSIREILDDSCAFFARPDNPRSFGDAIARVFADPAGASERARAARSAVSSYSWKMRAEKITSLCYTGAS